MIIRFRGILIFLFLLLSSHVSHARETTSQGAEIISYHTFGEGLMVTKAKMAPISGTVNNIFFYNRADLPWNGNVWYEYDWEIRGAHPTGGWSQIRVREEDGGKLKDAPINVTMLENLGHKFLHYILIRQDNKYVYDVREDFDIDTYDYSIAEAHEGNSSSIIEGGARVFLAGGNVADIPEEARLDFSLGITAFDINWTGALPGEAYSGDYAVDFARFYGFDDNDKLIKRPKWFDEFNSGSLDYSKWFPATWTYQDTQFTTDNLRFENGYVVMRANRAQDETDISETNIALSGIATQSSTVDDGEASLAIDGSIDGSLDNKSVILTEEESNAWWELELKQNSDIDQIVIYNSTNDSLADYTVSILDENDNVMWTQFYTESSSIVTINLDAIGKKVRINLKGVLSLAEVEVYGTLKGVSVPSLIQAEDYVDYVDTTLTNRGAKYRSDSVDIQETKDIDGGYNVGWIKSGEWLEYPISVSEEGIYTADIRVASTKSTGSFDVQIDGVVQDSVDIERTGGWQVWKTKTVELGALSKGEHTIRIDVTGSDFNLNWIDVKKDVSEL